MVRFRREFQSQTPQPAWDAAWDRVRAERKQAGLPNTYALGAFCLWEFRVFSTNLNILRSICSGHGDPARRAAATAAADGSPRSYPRPTPTAASGQGRRTERMLGAAPRLSPGNARH